jgi:peroxiredoxin
MTKETTHELKAARQYYRDMVFTAPVLFIMDAETARLKDSGLYEASRWIGKKVEDFSLHDQLDRPVSLYATLEKGPVVLTFYRGSWCPYCNIALRGLQRNLDRFRELGAQLVAVSPQRPDRSLTTAEKYGLEFPVLSDVGNRVARQLGLSFRLSDSLAKLYRDRKLKLEEVNGPEGADELPIPATLLIFPDRTIHYAFVDVDYTRRMDPEDIIAILAALPQELKEVI